MTVNERTGVIHDIGYQRYKGARLGRRYVVGSLLTHSLRTAYGLGRSGKAKVFPWGVVGILVLVAGVVSAVRASIGQVVLPYDNFPNAVVLLVVMFCAIVAPELVSRDLHSGVLQLYVARPMYPVDYAVAKLAAMVAAVWLLLAGPLLLMFVAGAFTVDGIRQVWDEVGELLPGLAYSAIMALVFSPLVLLVASLIRRRTVAAAVVVGAFIVTTPVVAVLNAVEDPTARQLSFLFSPMTLVAGVRQALFGDGGMPIGDMGPVYVVVAAALAAGSAGLLVARYRRAAV